MVEGGTEEEGPVRVRTQRAECLLSAAGRFAGVGQVPTTVCS